MTVSLPTFHWPLDTVLLGSGLAAGPLDWVLLATLAILWLIFGLWLLRGPAPVRRGRTLVLHAVAGLGLAVAALARDAALFYSGVAMAGYGTVALLLIAHGAAHARTAAVQVALMVLGDLVLFEMLVSLYSQASSAEFDELRTAYAIKGQGVSFVSALLVVTGGSKVAVLLLLVPVTDRLPAWRPGAASGLLCVALVSGVLPVVRLVDPLLSSASARYSLLAIPAAAIFLCLLFALCILGKSRLDAAAQRVSTLASRSVTLGVRGLATLEALARHVAPMAAALEQRMLSWPFAVAAAATLALLLAMTFGGLVA
ncbi:hypothetical protein [Chromatocurvus halotolerans]|uniref:Uncharacterized protein n=1 Tax=Chromatocurvus halotolerans TaxID=1132028 RepID=A0A4R2KV01_9GAMM|nr:hypothetical protein [Chromatocurvus halotolerans]TCO78291.1 hypothetical protein EV688_101104 [Chromatocurvus halotolerans]